MNTELIEIREFLAGLPPFDRLGDELLDKLAVELTVRCLGCGTPFPPQDAEQAFLYILRKGAVELHDERDELVAKYGEGDVYAAVCLPEDSAHGLRGVVVEDSLFYLLPCERLQALRDADKNFDACFARSLGERLRRAREILHDSSRDGGRLLAMEIGRIIKRSPVAVTADTSIQEAARIMTRERVSSLLIVENGLLAGIITDRDIRSRCVAQGVPTTRPVRDIMTRGLHKVTPDTLAFEAMISMTRHKIHHLPVVSEKGIEGVVTATDLIRHQSINSIYAVDGLRKCNTVAELVRASAVLPDLQVQLVAAGASAYQLGQAISAATDAVTQRLLELAEREYGPAPVPYVWVACGSQGRREQTMRSDQDNALILSDEYDFERHADYFAKLAQYVNDGLNACGFDYCPGGVMASNPKWRQPRSVWRRYFDMWIARTDRKGAMLATNFFDMRPVHGDPMLHARLHADVLRQAKESKIFLAYMAGNAVVTRPPLGFFRNFVLIKEGEHANSFDLKLYGILPVVNLVRVYALTAGTPELNTVERIKAAAGVRAISPDMAIDLESAFEFIGTLRARHQAQQIKQGIPPDNYLMPDKLGTLERSHLKDIFSFIKALQKTLELHYQTGRLI